MRALIALSAAVLSTTGCATPGGPSDPGGSVSNGEDCAVITAIAKEHYRFNTTDNRPPPLWVNTQDSAGRPWRLQCDWSRVGLSFPETYDPANPGPNGARWVQFKKPRYDGQGATVETDLMTGPLAGVGVICHVRSGFAGWTVSECRDNWIS